MRGLHYVLHAPQGDTYADLLFTMIERRDRRPPVTYTTFQARDLGGDTAELFKTRGARGVRALPARGDDRRRLVHRRTDPGRSGRPRARAEPADPGHPARAAVLPAQGKLGRGRDLLPAGAHAGRARQARRRARRARPSIRPRCNMLGPTALGFRHRDDLREITQLLDGDRHRRQRHGAARRHAGRPRAPRRGRLQRRAVSGDRRPRPRAGSKRTFGQPFDDRRADRRRRDARVHRRGRARSPGSTRGRAARGARIARPPGIRARSTRPT